MECYSCLANRGEWRMAPSPAIYDGEYWSVEHAYPTALVGWLVLVLKRHAEALHELSTGECAEMSELLGRTARALREETGCEKEYIACFTEADHFHHVHIHVVSRQADLAQELQGSRIFALLKPAPEKAAAPEDLVACCERVRERLAQA